MAGGDGDTLAGRIESNKHSNILKGATIRRIKQLLNKFNNFHNGGINRLNKYERHRYKLLYDYEKTELKPRFETIDDLYSNLSTIEQMGFSLFYYIDDDNPDNNDFMYCLEYGRLRGDRVPEPFKYDRSLYKSLRDHREIFKLSNDREAAMYENLRGYGIAADTPPPVEDNLRVFSINGFNFTADELGQNLILQYMAQKKATPIAVATY